MSKCFLKLNIDKTEIVEICPFRHRNCKKCILSLNINSLLPVKPSKSAKSLGFYFDSDLSSEKQITKLVKKCNYRLNNLYSLGSKLDRDLKLQFVQCYIMSCIDYCNSVYYDMSSNLLKRLQMLQNNCARFVCGYSRQ